jgi:hypothetical protein
VSRWHLERAIYLLGHNGPLTRGHEAPGRALEALIERVRLDNEEDPTTQYPPFRLEPDEVKLIADSDVTGMYLRGIHPNLIRNFAGVWDIDYVAIYRSAGL